MQWWVWLVVVVVVVGVTVLAFGWVQARRRRGGVIVVRHRASVGDEP